MSNIIDVNWKNWDWINQQVFNRNVKADIIAISNSLPSNNLKNEFIANENITIYKPVTFMGTIINTNNISHANKFFGISTTNTLTGFTGNLISEGEITNPSWNLTQGDNIFLNGSDFSNIAPVIGFTQLIGQAKNQTTIVLNKNQALII